MISVVCRLFCCSGLLMVDFLTHRSNGMSNDVEYVVDSIRLCFCGIHMGKVGKAILVTIVTFRYHFWPYRFHLPHATVLQTYVQMGF